MVGGSRLAIHFSILNRLKLWAAENDLLFVDTHGVYKMHTAIRGIVKKMRSLRGCNRKFTKLTEHIKWY